MDQTNASDATCLDAICNPEPNRRPRTSRVEFKHDALDHSVPSIRLIQILPKWSPEGYIQCSMRHATLDTSTRYGCLSYVWGPPDAGHWIIINGRRLRVRKNLATFLQYVRIDRLNEWLWIDALCIDQSNPKERNHQVQQMGRIFSSAVEVISWLGDDDTIAAYLREVRKFGFSPSETGLQALVASEYWNRAWITQEILLAREVILMACTEYTAMRQMSQSNAQKLLRIDPRNSSAHRKKGLIHLLWIYRDKRCAHPRDRIFSLLSLCDPPSGLSVNYEIPHHLLATATLRACGSLCLCSTYITGHALGLKTLGAQYFEQQYRLVEAVFPVVGPASLDRKGVYQEHKRNWKHKVVSTFLSIFLGDMCPAYHPFVLLFRIRPDADGFYYLLTREGAAIPSIGSKKWSSSGLRIELYNTWKWSPSGAHIELSADESSYHVLFNGSLWYEIAKYGATYHSPWPSVAIPCPVAAHDQPVQSSIALRVL
jgi:hypothetical protein